MRVLLFSLFALAASPAALACGGTCDGSCAEHAEHASAEMEAVKAAEGTKVELAVTGVHCMGTAAAAKSVLLGMDGVVAVAVDVSGKTLVAYDAAKVDTAKLIAAFEKVEGFKAAVATKEG